MQIEQIQVKNYGVLRNAKLTLPSPLTVIVGANGAGKSTLFDVFAFLKDASLAMLPLPSPDEEDSGS